MGLVMLGTASEKALDEMLQYAHETQHEKIIRGLAIGISFLMFGKEEEADGLIETLLGDAVRFSPSFSIRCETMLMIDMMVGCDSTIRRNLHNRHGVRRNGKQQSDSKTSPRRRFGRQRRCTTSSRHFPRIPPLPKSDSSTEDRSAIE